MLRAPMLDVQQLPKQLDWCVLTRRDTPLSGSQRLLRDHVPAHGALAAACKLQNGGRTQRACAYLPGGSPTWRLKAVLKVLAEL